jgi:hypothetical protein
LGGLAVGEKRHMWTEDSARAAVMKRWATRDALTDQKSCQEHNEGDQ